MDVTKILTIGLSANAVAVDLGADFVKVLAIQRQGRKVSVVGAGVEKTPASAVVDGQVMRQDLLIPALKSALAKAGISSRSYLPAIVGLRGISVACARLILPVLSEEEMSVQIVQEAQQHISADLDEWRIDFDVVSPPDERGQVVVILVGARNSVLSSYVEVLRACSLNLEVVDLDVFAMANAVENSLGEVLKGNWLCLDLGRDATRICLINDSSPHVVRSVSVCGQDLTAAIATRCQLSIEDAEALKIAPLGAQGGVISPELQTCFDAFCNDLCVEIKNTIAFFASSSASSADVTIDNVFLTGGGARLHGLSQKISSSFGAQVTLMNPLARLSITEEVEKIVGADGYRFAVVAGLAQRKRNDKEEKEVEKTPDAPKEKTSLGGFAAIPHSSRKLVWMVGGGAALFAAISYFGWDFSSTVETEKVGAAAAKLDETGLPKTTPENYRKILESLEKQETKAKEKGEALPDMKQKQLQKLRGMKTKGEI